MFNLSNVTKLTAMIYFQGMRIVKQHKLVTEALKKEIGDMHGIRISTNASPCQH